MTAVGGLMTADGIVYAPGTNTSTEARHDTEAEESNPAATDDIAVDTWASRDTSYPWCSSSSSCCPGGWGRRCAIALLRVGIPATIVLDLVAGACIVWACVLLHQYLNAPHPDDDSYALAGLAYFVYFPYLALDLLQLTVAARFAYAIWGELRPNFRRQPHGAGERWGGYVPVHAQPHEDATGATGAAMTLSTQTGLQQDGVCMSVLHVLLCFVAALFHLGAVAFFTGDAVDAGWPLILLYTAKSIMSTLYLVGVVIYSLSAPSAEG